MPCAIIGFTSNDGFPKPLTGMVVLTCGWSSLAVEFITSWPEPVRVHSPICISLTRVGDVEAIRSRIPDAVWQCAVQSCERTITCFPGSFYAGIDLLITTGYRHHAILEINAFGDLLPGVLHNGLDTYSAELRAWLNQLSRFG